MAKPSSNAPATESSPQTEAHAKKDVVDVSGGLFTDPIAPLPRSDPNVSAPVDDDSWFGNLFDDDDDDQKSIQEQQLEATRALPDNDDFKSAWRLAGDSRDPISSKIAFAETYGNRQVDVDLVKEESGLEPIISFDKAMSGASYVAGKGKDLYDAAPSPVQYTTDMVVKAGGAVLSQLEYGDVGRSELWTHGYKWSGRTLPDTDNWFGDALGDLTGKSLEGLARLYEWDMGAPNPTSAFDSDTQEEEYYKDIDALGKNIYSAFADAKLYKKAIDRKGYFINRPDWWGVLEGANATGEDLLNTAFPIDMMKRLDANSPKTRYKGMKPTSTSSIISQLSDPVSRMGWGLALEVAADPLWMLGAAKATQVVNFAGKAWNLGEKGARVAGHLERYAQTMTTVVGKASFFQKRVVQAIVGTTDEANEARAMIIRVSDDAKAEAIAAQQKSQRFMRLAEDVKGGKVDDALAKLQAELADELDSLQALAKKYADPDAGLSTRRNYEMTKTTIRKLEEDILQLSSGNAKHLEKALLVKAGQWVNNAHSHLAAASEIRSYVDVIRRSKPVAAGLVEKSKIPIFGTFHVPFKESTYTMGTAGQIETVANKMNQALGPDNILASGVRSVKEGLDIVSENAMARKAANNIRLGLDRFASFSVGERLVDTARSVGEPLARITYQGVDTLARMIGSRHWMPMVASRGLSKEFKTYGARGAYMIGLTPTDSSFIRLKRLRPELWENYQTSITNYMNKLSYESEVAGTKIQSMYLLAGGANGRGGALANWKASIEKVEIPRLDAEIAELRAKLQNPSFSAPTPNGWTDSRVKSTIIRELKAKESLRLERLEVLSDDYDIHSFMDEVARLVETGAGNIDETPWLKATVAKWNEISEGLAVSLNKPLEEVQQALIAMARFGTGDKEASIGLARRLQVLQQLMDGADNVPSETIVRMDQLTDALSVRLNSKGKVLNSVTTEKLTEILYRTLDIAGEAKFNKETAQAIDNALMKALGGDRALADEILSYASAYYGRSPEKSLRLLAFEHSGELQRFKEQVLAGEANLVWPHRENLLNAEPHKFITDTIPFPPGTDHTTSLYELAHILKSASREHRALYRSRTGKLITMNAGKSGNVDPFVHLYDDSIDKLTELVATGDVVIVHNNPATPEKSALGNMFGKNGLDDLPELKGLKPAFDDVMSNVPPSIEDMKYTIAINAKNHYVVNPDGTMWMIRRPEKGWPFVSENTTVFKDRLAEVEAALKRGDDPSPTMKAVDKEFSARHLAAEEDLLNSMEAMNRDLSDLRQAYDTGLITKRQYGIIKKGKVNDWSSLMLNNQTRTLSEIELDVFQEVFGIRPFRSNIPGRFNAKPAVLLGETADAAKIERRIVRNRIKSSIQDAKLKTRATLNEIRSYRLNPREDFKFFFSLDATRALVSTRYVDSLDEFNRIASKHSFIDEGAKTEFYDEIVRWIESDYPDGIDIPDVSRSADAWLLEKSDILNLPSTVSAKDIDSIKKSIIKVKKVEDQFIERISVLNLASKRLEKVEGPLTRGKIKRDAAKLRKQRTEDVLKRLLDDSPDVATAKARIRIAFDDLLDLPDDPIYSRLKDELAETLSKRSYGGKTKIGPAVAETREAGRALLKAEFTALQKELAETIPRLKIPTAKPGEDIIRNLKEWEYTVWDEFKKVTSSLSEEETLLVAFGALADSPKIFGGVGDDLQKAMKLRYQALLGRRMESIPEELEPVRDAFKSLIKHYEDLYIKHGMDFVKSPEDMLRLWGVIDYVPHVERTAEKASSGNPFGRGMGVSHHSDDLDKAFSTNIDQRRKRTIQGSMAEINAAIGGNLGVDPMNLTHRYMSAAKAISGQEFMYSLLAGGVLKIIAPKPVYESLLHKYATKYKMFPDTELDKVPSSALEAAVRAKASKTELSILDDALANAADQIIPASQRASDIGYVPIFERASPTLSNDLVLNGSKTDWHREGLIPESVMDKFDEIKDYSSKDRGDKFAKFIRDSAVIRQSDDIISVVSFLKAKSFQAGEELYDPVSRFKQIKSNKLWEMRNDLLSKGKSPDEIGAILTKKTPKIESDSWNALSTEMNKMMNAFDKTTRVSGGNSLKTFYAQGEQMWNLYVPGVVRESMDEIFIKKAASKSALMKYPQVINNFWKVRLTIVAAAFHARNFTSNIFSNMLDSGIATFSPSVAIDAGRLSSLANFHGTYGSIKLARKILSAPKGAAEKQYQYAARQLKLKMLDGLDGVNVPYDIGDGIIRNADEALAILTERGVIAGGMQQFIDINTFETRLSNIYVTAGLEKHVNSAVKFASVVEDGAIVALPMLIAGFPIPVGIPKGIGASIGRSIENQARISSFIVNARKTQSFDVASKHVQKFLFNYNDLTQTQKSWMRVLIPFFTWTQKNVSLQIKMMQENPVFYSNFQRLLIHQGPEIVERYNAETLGIPYIPKWGSSREALALRSEHTRNMIRFPVPGKAGYYIEGLGLPQEAFFEQTHMIKQLMEGIPLKFNPDSPIRISFKDSRLDNRKPHLRMMGQTHFILKAIYEGLMEKHSTFMDMPISEMTNGRVAFKTIAGYRKIPIIGGPIADAITSEVGMHSYQPMNPKTGDYMDDVYIKGVPNYWMSNHPWSRITKDASAAALLTNMTYLDRMPQELRKKYSSAEYEPLSDAWKILDAMGSIRIIVTNEEASRARQKYDITKRYEEAFRRAGITKEIPIKIPKEQK
tara:strand:+ start:17193 stop:25307 length:8115 start_codon:yes stop_codon:yes gene_type:complete